MTPNKQQSTNIYDVDEQELKFVPLMSKDEFFALGTWPPVGISPNVKGMPAGKNAPQSEAKDSGESRLASPSC